MRQSAAPFVAAEARFDRAALAPIGAVMAELIPSIPTMMYVSNEQRRRAALAVAEAFGDSAGRVARALCILGLAEHALDGSFDTVLDEDGVAWFRPLRQEGVEALRVRAGTLDDFR